MPIVNTDVIEGPNVQATGEYRGTLEFTFDDGRTFRRNVRAPDASSWANLIVDLPANVESQIAVNDASEAVDLDQEVQDYKQASKKLMALAYLRKAHSNEDPYKAYLQFSRFNDWRLAEGYTLDQVQAALASVGLEVDEYNDMKAAYQWLSNPARVTAMQAYQDIAIGWPDFRGL